VAQDIREVRKPLNEFGWVWSGVGVEIRDRHDDGAVGRDDAGAGHVLEHASEWRPASHARDGFSEEAPWAGCQASPENGE